METPGGVLEVTPGFLLRLWSGPVAERSLEWPVTVRPPGQRWLVLLATRWGWELSVWPAPSWALSSTSAQSCWLLGPGVLRVRELDPERLFTGGVQRDGDAGVRGVTPGLLRVVSSYRDWLSQPETAEQGRSTAWAEP